MKLNLKQVLALTGQAKPRFDSARRRELYGFMYEAMTGDGPVDEYENSRNRFGLEHVVGIACVEYATAKLGMSPDMADSIVCNNFGELTEAVRSGAIDPDRSDTSLVGGPNNHFFIGAVVNVVGRGHYAGSVEWFRDKLLAEVIRSNDGEEHADNGLAGVVMIDATTVYLDVKARLLGGLSVA